MNIFSGDAVNTQWEEGPGYGGSSMGSRGGLFQHGRDLVTPIGEGTEPPAEMALLTIGRNDREKGEQ